MASLSGPAATARRRLAPMVSPRSGTVDVPEAYDGTDTGATSLPGFVIAPPSPLSPRPAPAPTPAAAVGRPLELLAHLVAAVLELTVGEVLGRLVQPEARLQRRHVGRPVGLGFEPELFHDPLTVLLGEHDGDRLDLGEEVEIGGQRGDGIVEEDQVLHEE